MIHPLKHQGHIPCLLVSLESLANGAGASKLQDMLSAKVQDFSLSTTCEYSLPVPFNDTKLHEFAVAICASAIGEFATAADIRISNQNELFSYSLFIPLFNGAASISLNAQGVTIAFKQGRSKVHLNLMTEYTLKTIELVQPPQTKRTTFSYAAHAVFDPPSGYAEYMRRFTDASLGITSGGVLWTAEIPECRGELRYATEKSLTFANGIFLTASGSHTGIPSKELLEIVAKRVGTLAEHDGVCFSLDE